MQVRKKVGREEKVTTAGRQKQKQSERASGIGAQERTWRREMREASRVGSGIKRCERLDANFKDSGQGNPHPTGEGPTRVRSTPRLLPSIVCYLESTSNEPVLEPVAGEQPAGLGQVALARHADLESCARETHRCRAAAAMYLA